MMNMENSRRQKIASCLGKVRERAPFVHCITNFVTVNDCANIILAAGGSPTMSKHPEEVAEITSGCQALVLNMGTVSDTEAMLIAGQKAKELRHPVILDPVGAGASALRRNTLRMLTEGVHPDVIRGNASEIRFLYDGSGNEAGGIDASLADRITEEIVSEWGALAKRLAERLSSIICISGAIDVISDGREAFAFPGGCREMSRITGSGCMLTALMGAFIGAGPEDMTDAVLCAQGMMNAAGEIACKKTLENRGGTMTFRMHLIDAVSLMTEEIWNESAKIDRISLCGL